MNYSSSGGGNETRISREEICKKFNLPERKTKIDTILKLRREQEQPVYCLCQSNDTSKFMIGCEKCDGWFHGECIGLEEKDAQQINKWYCFDCIALYNLKIVYFTNKKEKSFHKNKKVKKRSKQENVSHKQADNFSCKQCSNCLQNGECGNKDGRMFFEKRPSNQKIHKNEETVIGKKSSNNQEREVYDKEKKQETNREISPDLEPRKCFSSNCLNVCRVNSKYCSDECGMALAKFRLLSIVHDKIVDLRSKPSVAYQSDVAKLEKTQKLKIDTAIKIRGLKSKEQAIRRLIEETKRLPITDFEEEEEDDSNKPYCITCGWEIPSRSFVKHMENCFRKAETQNIVENVTKSNSKYCNIFCDHYNADKNTYCMRLRYLCPHHFKARKAGNNEVCGCPIITKFCTNLFLEAERFCQKPKISCSQHYNWEILAISEVDLDHQREFNKFSCLMKQEDDIMSRMSNRNGVLGMLLHSTQEH